MTQDHDTFLRPARDLRPPSSPPGSHRRSGRRHLRDDCCPTGSGVGACGAVQRAPGIHGERMDRMAAELILEFEGVTTKESTR